MDTGKQTDDCFVMRPSSVSQLGRNINDHVTVQASGNCSRVACNIICASKLELRSFLRIN